MKGKFTLVIILAAIVGMGISFPNAVSAGDIVIVCNKSVPEATVTKDEVKNIFVGKKTRWSDDNKIIFVTLNNNDVHEAFLKDYVKKTPSQFSRYWKKKVFTGRGTAPKSFSSEKSLVDFVANTQGAIGYISSNTDTEKIKILQVTD